MSMRTGLRPSTSSVRSLVSFSMVISGASVSRNETMAARARRAFANVGSISTSTSFVARGRAWNATAYPPTIKYRTRWVFSETINSTKSGNTFSLHAQAVDQARVYGFDALCASRVLEPILQVERVGVIDLPRQYHPRAATRR